MSVKEADDKKDEMENILRQKLTDAFTSGLAWKIDWDSEPLPLYVQVKLLVTLKHLSKIKKHYKSFKT